MKSRQTTALEVFNPTGAVDSSSMYAPRLDTIEGKTICELSNGAWEAHTMFPPIRELLQERFPSAEFIPYTELPTGVTAIDVDSISKIVEENKCEAAILGNCG
ncbi:MAG: hypothetical protein HYX90_03895 [Chloroflexi bacterium]|nr:hypothetical protein [Chloroflexota bacterium]